MSSLWGCLEQRGALGVYPEAERRAESPQSKPFVLFSCALPVSSGSGWGGAGKPSASAKASASESSISFTALPSISCHCVSRSALHRTPSPTRTPSE
eukprot:scaffold49424_cov61-Phaeocystis_antarctica.AAC.6